MWNRAPPGTVLVESYRGSLGRYEKIFFKKRCQTLEELQEAVNQFVRRKLTPESNKKLNQKRLL